MLHLKKVEGRVCWLLFMCEEWLVGELSSFAITNPSHASLLGSFASASGPNFGQMESAASGVTASGNGETFPAWSAATQAIFWCKRVRVVQDV